MSRVGIHRIALEPERASSAIGKARAFLTSSDYPLGSSLLDHIIGCAPSEPVIEALAHYQNPDGGFGRGLEVDIASPASNPFATRLAMTVLSALESLPDAATPMLASLSTWLTTSQAPDGNWHLSTATRSDALAPWFAAWEHPNLNPALCLVGYAQRLGIGSAEMQARTAALFEEKASVDAAASADFYSLLPYVEYVVAMPAGERDAYLDAIAANINANHATIYADAGHFWEQVLAAGPELVARLDPALRDRFALRLLDEQADDGGWPTPYDQAWRPWFTTMSACILHELAHH